MSNPNLVRKVITDINGVTSTRWVKADGSDSPRAINITPPSVAQQLADTPKARMERALDVFSMETLSEGGYRNGVGEKAYNNLWFLAQHAPQLLERLISQSSDDGHLGSLWHHRVNSITMSPLTHDDRDREQHLTTWERRLDIYPMGIDLIQSIGDHNGIDKLLRDHTLATENTVYNLISWGTNTLNRDATEKPDPELAKAVALICIIRGYHDERYWRMDNSRLQYADIAEDAEYISKHVAEVTALVPELVERKSHDPELIRNMLSQASSLREGML